MSRVRVGVLGCGMIAQLMHLPYLSELREEFEIVAVCDLHYDLAVRVGSRFGVPAIYDDFSKMLDNNPELDAVLILNSDHYLPVKLALQRGIHTFTEKPLCYTVSEAEEIVSLSESCKAKLMVGYVKRFDTGVTKGLDEIRSMDPHMAAMRLVVGPRYGNWIIPELHDLDYGDVNDPVKHDDRPDRIYEERSAITVKGLSAYMSMFGVWSHDINLLRHALPAPVSTIHSEVSESGETLSTLLRHTDGLQCVFQGTSTDARYFEETLTVWGSDRIVTMEISNPFLRHIPTTVRIQEEELEGATRLGGSHCQERIITGDFDEAFRKQLQHFHDCVVTGSLQPDTNAHEALEDTRLMADIIRHAEAH